MRNHHEKTRDMARALLPSKLGVKNWRRNIHHSERGRARVALHRARITDQDDLDGLSDDAVDANHTKHRAHEMVQERRAAVNVGPLLRWAEHHLDRDPDLGTFPTNSLDYLTSRLPPGVVGRPAATRIAKTVGRADTNRWIVDDSTVGVRDAVRWVMASGLHAELNCLLRKSLGACHPASSWKPDELRPRHSWHRCIDHTHVRQGVRIQSRCRTDEEVLDRLGLQGVEATRQDPVVGGLGAGDDRRFPNHRSRPKIWK